MRLTDKIKLQISTVLQIPKRLRLNGFRDGTMLFWYNSMLIWVDDETKRKRFYQQKHCLDSALIIQLAKSLAAESNFTPPIICDEYKIFVLWWQGEEAMPPIIHTTIASIKAASNKEVVLITLKNVKEYINIPDYIWQKYCSKKMGAAHFADYTRMALLEKYGGLWIDSTVLCTGKLPNWIYEQDFFTIRAIEYTTNILDEKYVAKGRWNTQVFGTNKKGHPFFSSIRSLLEQYWKEHNYMIDYLLFDDFILYVYNTNPFIREAIDSVPLSNKKMHTLLPLMNSPFDKKRWEDLTSNTFMFKLTYKGNYNEKSNNLTTFYHHILHS